jgi:hypothetical protein
MPFDDDFRKIYDRLIVPALNRAGYEVTRADSELDQQNVLKDVVRGIAMADLVIADLTSRNPNVLYELGLSHALGRNTVLLAQSMDEVPFDLRSYRIVRYSTEFDEAENLASQLEKIGEKHVDGEIEFGSPITDFLLDDKGGSDSSVSTLREVADETGSEEGFLDAFVNFEGSSNDIKERLTRIGDSTERVGEKFESSSEKMRSIQRAGGPGVVVQAHRIASEVGNALGEFAQELEEESPGVATDVETLINGGMGFTSWVTSQTEIDIESAEVNREQLQELGTATAAGLNGLQSFRTNLVELGPISSDVARGSKRAIGALDGITGSLEQVQAFTEKAVDLLDERLAREQHESSSDGPE